MPYMSGDRQPEQRDIDNIVVDPQTDKMTGSFAKVRQTSQSGAADPAFLRGRLVHSPKAIPAAEFVSTGRHLLGMEEGVQVHQRLLLVLALCRIFERSTAKWKPELRSLPKGTTEWIWR